MKIFFCGSTVPEEIEHTEKNISAAGNRFQQNVVKNLKQLGYTVQQLSYIGMGVSEHTKEELERDKGEQVQYVIKQRNILKQLWKFNRRLKRAIAENDCAVCYNVVHMWFILPYFCRMKKKKSILILADYSGPESYKNIVRKVYSRLQLMSMRKFDCVVGLSANVKKLLGSGQQFHLMEGGIDEQFYRSFTYTEKGGADGIHLLYSGLLSPVTGVDMLLQAFDRMKNENVYLHITGKGPMSTLAEKAAEEDKRILLKGNLTYEKYIEELQAADIVVNPRNMSMAENQNNFPSKIMDYLASGKIIVSTKFVGWEKFKNHILFCDNDVESLKRCLEKAAEGIGNAEKIYSENRKQAAQFEWKRQLQKIFEEGIS